MVLIAKNRQVNIIMKKCLFIHVLVCIYFLVAIIKKKVQTSFFSIKGQNRPNLSLAVVVGSSVMHTLFLKETLRQGTYFTQPESVKQIPSFVQHYSIDMNNYVIQDVAEYKNFNEFFTRAILPEKRPVADTHDDNVLVSSADCRLNVFDSVDSATELWIKGKNFTLGNLLKDEQLAESLQGGSIAVFRLAPQDYHRFHIPAKGTIESMNTLDGTYYTGKVSLLLFYY